MERSCILCLVARTLGGRKLKFADQYLSDHILGDATGDVDAGQLMTMIGGPAASCHGAPDAARLDAKPNNTLNGPVNG